MNEAGKVRELPIDDILPNRFQPRIKFSESEVLALSESIKNHGVIQPILVRPIGDKYEIIAGERRYKASVMAGLKEIPAIVRQLDDKQSAELALIENVQRKDLTPIEEALSYQKILSMGYLTQDQLAAKLGKKQSTIANKLRLLNLDEDVQNALLYEKISERHARSLLKLNQEQQKEMLKRIIQERLTVRQTDIEIQKILEKQNETNPQEKIIDEDIEILDFPEEETVKKMEEPKQAVDYNIPTNEIKNDIPDVPTGTSTSVNPGFMDVDKIVETAQDINRPTQKDKKTIEDLLKPDAQMIQMEEQEKAEQQQKEEAEQILKPGKFFNLSDLEDTDDTNDNNNGFIENIDRAEANMDFGVKPNPAPTTGFDFDKFFNASEFEKTLEPTTQNQSQTNSDGEQAKIEQEQKEAKNSEIVEPTIQMNPEINPTTVVEKEALANIDNQKAEVPVENVYIPSLEESSNSLPQQDVSNLSTPLEEPTSINNQTSPTPVENVSIPSLEETFQSSEVNQTFNNTQLPDEKKEETSIISEIPQMSEEEFLNSLPDNNLPLSAIDNSEKNINQEQVIDSQPGVNQVNDSKDENVISPIEPVSEAPELIGNFDQEISPVEPVISENTNSFLFEPEDDNDITMNQNPSSLNETGQVPAINSIMEKNDEHIESNNLEEKNNNIEIFNVQKVSAEAKSFAQSLQDKGYQVRIEEYDFEDLYQVVLKVRKDV